MGRYITGSALSPNIQSHQQIQTFRCNDPLENPRNRSYSGCRSWAGFILPTHAIPAWSV